MPSRARAILLILLPVLLAAGGCGGGSASLSFDPSETTPTRLESSDGRIVAVFPADAFSSKVIVTLTNCTGSDRGAGGPEGRTLVMAMELKGVTVREAPADGGDSGTGGGAAEPEPVPPAELAAPVEITFELPSYIRPDLTVPVYIFNSASQRYEPAEISGTLAEDGLTLTFTIGDFGRYAIYSLLPEELPPPAPGGLTLLAASTQVRKLGWTPAGRPDVAGYNLYRADSAATSYTRVNSALLTAAVYSDELASPGSYRYHVTSVSTGELESDPSPDVVSPNVDFDVAFTFGEDVLLAPQALALDAAGDRLVVADPGAGCLRIYSLGGRLKQTLTQYSSGAPVDPRGVAFNADASRLYISDGAMHSVVIVDGQYNIAGLFGGEGAGPGEFDTPGAVIVKGDKVLVADSAQSTLQAFTPLGVYLAAVAGAGTGAGQLDTPEGLLLDDDGRLYLSDSGHDQLLMFAAEDLKYDAAITFAAADGGPFSGPTGLALDFRGRLYVGDAGNRRVVVFDDGGGFLFHFGSDGALWVEFSATDGPAGLALDRSTGYLYVCDPGNHRVVVFKS